MKGLAELLEKIDQCDPGTSKQAVTVLDGEHIAEKALVADGKFVWMSDDDGFFRSHQHVYEADPESGTVEVDGVKVFCDTLGNEKQLVICGAGHVSIPIIRIAVMMHWQVTVLEDRPMYANHARTAGASRVLCEPLDEGLEKVEGSPDTYFVIVTRGHRHDQMCLKQICQKEHAYIGMIGSRKRTALVKETLAKEGCSRTVLNEVYTPIGLDIAAETPEEIAIAIMAEIVEVKNRKKRTYGYSKELARAITDGEEDPGHKVLATIVTRRGSAPQGIGTKMLIRQDGTCIGTIGGGCMEAEIFRKALVMLRVNGPMSQLCHVDMSGDEAEEEGMVCGGAVDVFLDRIA